MTPVTRVYWTIIALGTVLESLSSHFTESGKLPRALELMTS